ncbi:MAG: transposase, partial [Burkholderiales bacterium]|nr:transposase [Burkholderiales bacterium]
MQDSYIACTDGLKSLPEAVAAVYPKTLTQLCIVHLVRASLRYVTATDAKAVVAALKRTSPVASSPRRGSSLRWSASTACQGSF